MRLAPGATLVVERHLLRGRRRLSAPEAAVINEPVNAEILERLDVAHGDRRVRRRERPPQHHPRDHRIVIGHHPQGEQPVVQIGGRARRADLPRHRRLPTRAEERPELRHGGLDLVVGEPESLHQVVAGDILGPDERREALLDHALLPGRRGQRQVEGLGDGEDLGGQVAHDARFIAWRVQGSTQIDTPAASIVVLAARWW